jgi:hypothetical protein
VSEPQYMVATYREHSQTPLRVYLTNGVSGMVG